MPLNGCSSGLYLVTAMVALLVLPAPYYLPDLHSGGPITSSELLEKTSGTLDWLDVALLQFSPFDLAVTATLLTLGLLTYIFEWIQRKLMERRIIKLNQYLSASVERLRAWDAQQEQLEAKLLMVQNATSEYNLLLYLLLQRHCLTTNPPHHSFHDKEMEQDIFLRTPNLDA